ncbi:hypothetical protein [Brachybacterium hainanense]|uniref:Uncharacterized protein n=1 Tax=Brachybacterium hainanense TaxID=1541174 RepID=A0ABV6RAH8_9MICO
MDRITPRVQAALETTDPTITDPTVEWARSLDPDQAGTAGVIVAEDGRIIARTFRPKDGSWAIDRDDARTLGLATNILDMNLGSLARAAGGPVRHVTGTEATSAPLRRAIPRTDAERELVASHLALQALEEKRAQLVGRRRTARAAVRAEKCTNQRAAALLGISEAAASKIEKR